MNSKTLKMFGITTETHFTSSIAKAKLHIIILTAISLYIIINFSATTKALDFTFNYPETIELNETFIFSIKAATSENYDVKIFVKDENEKIISEIFSNGWKNPFFYLKEVFPKQSDFKIHIVKSATEYIICARLRKSGRSQFEEKCNKINISPINREIKQKNAIEQEEIRINKIEENDETSKLESQLETSNKNENEKEPLRSEISTINDIQEKITGEIIEKNKDKEKIILNSNSKSEENKIFTTRYEVQKQFILYAFLAFCVLLIIFLAIRRL